MIAATTGPDDATPDIRTIAGALADADRRRVFAAIELGATSLEAVTVVATMSTPDAAKALGRLIDNGLVVHGADGTLSVAGDALAAAARTALTRRRDEHDGQPPEVKRVLDSFVRDGVITSWPTARTAAGRAKQLVLLHWLAGRFDVGRRYTEAEVNELLGGHAEDHASLRRRLVDAGLLDRDAREYWRSGGTVA